MPFSAEKNRTRTILYSQNYNIQALPVETWYFETSAINYMLSNQLAADPLATRVLQLRKGRDWRISPACLWEIMCTRDSATLENLLSFSQNAFSPDLMPSVSELIVAFIQKGMPIDEPFRPLSAKSVLADTWRSIVSDRSRTLILDQKELREKIKLIQGLTKKAHGITKTQGSLLTGSDDIAGLDAMLNSMVNRLPFVVEGEPVDPDDRHTYKLSIYFILALLCSELEIENAPIQNYWASVGINSTIDRLVYVVEHLPALVHRGPFVLMAQMSKAQGESQRKYPRGVWFDCMHAVYVSYVESFYTGDEHFSSFREDIGHPLLAHRIKQISKVPWYSTEIEYGPEIGV